MIYAGSSFGSVSYAGGGLATQIARLIRATFQLFKKSAGLSLMKEVSESKVYKKSLPIELQRSGRSGALLRKGGDVS